MGEELIEITFEDVQLDKLLSLVINIVLTSESAIPSIEAIDSNLLGGYKLLPTLVNTLKSALETIFLNFKKIILNGIVLENVSLQIVKYDRKKFDLNILIDYKELFSNLTIKDLQVWVSKLASTLSVKNYYCGYEPAHDTETRFFTEQKLGPII